MASSWQYISILKKPSAGETLRFTFQQLNILTDSFYVDILISASDSEEQTALIIKDALNAYFSENEYLYQGVPSFSRDGYPPFTLIAVVCDHVIHVWSQVGFKITCSLSNGNAPETIIDIAEVPVFTTIEAFQNIAPSYGISLLNKDGSEYSEQQIVQMAKIGSNQIIRLLNGFKICASTYLTEHMGNYKLGFKFEVRPVLYEDRPIVRGPYFSNMSAQYDCVLEYDIDYQDGLLKFPNYGIYQRQPLDINNVLKMTYVAGFATIPSIVQEETSHIASFLKFNPMVESIKQGTFQINYRDFMMVRNEIQQSLNGALGR